MGTGSPLTRPSRIRYGVLAFACTLALITYLDRVCIMRVQEDVQRDLGISDKGLGIVFGAFALGYTVFEVPGGLLGDRYGARRVLAAIVVWWSVFTALTGCVWRFTLDSGHGLSLWGFEVPLLLNGLVVLVLVRFLFGAGEAGAFPNVAQVCKTWFPYRERALAQGFIWMSARIGGAFAPMVIGGLAVAIGWRPAFWTLGLVGLVWAAAFYWWFRDRPEDKPECNAAELELIHEADEARPGSAAAAHGWPPLRPMLASATVWALCLGACGVCFAWYFFPTWQPRYLKEVHGIRIEDSEVLVGLPFLFGAVGSFAGGGLSDRLVRRIGRRWGRSLVGLIGFTGAGLCFVAAAYAPGAWMAVAFLCLAFLLNDLAIPVIWAVCADIGGRFVGTVSGIMNMIGGVGAMLGPALLPQVKDALPVAMPIAERWQIILLGLGVTWLVSAAAWLFIDASKPLFGQR
jgi:MFS family permease